MKLEITLETTPSQSIRARQVRSLFEVPAEAKQTLTWKGDVPLHEKPWQVGLIVGPSGAGKSTCMCELFGEQAEVTWGESALVDDFAEVSVAEMADALGAVGLGTVPAWLRPYHTLSTGERFRADLARHLLSTEETIVVDEFTSVVDRQVAKVGSHAAQKYVRKRDNKRFVAVTCHYDVERWLNPDWVFEPATMTFRWRSLQPRPEVTGTIQRVAYSEWARFAPFHYLTSKLHKAAQCFGLYVDGVEHPVAFCGLLSRMGRMRKGGRARWAESRTVVLPDWQGLGLNFVLVDQIAAALKACSRQMRRYPAHPHLIRAIDRSPRWRLVATSLENMRIVHGNMRIVHGPIGGRPCTVFQYCGPAMPDQDKARAFLDIPSLRKK